MNGDLDIRNISTIYTSQNVALTPSDIQGHEYYYDFYFTCSSSRVHVYKYMRNLTLNYSNIEHTQSMHMHT